MSIKNETEEKFLYTENVHKISIPFSSNMGLYKRAKSLHDSGYSSTAKVYGNEDYSYQIRFASEEESRAKGLIIYDSLENYTPVGGEYSGWKGSLKSVGLSEVRRLGIDPAVYYSTTPKLSIPDHQDLSEEGVWIRKEDYTGSLKDVTAVAVDMTRDANGNMFTMPPDTSVEITLYMHSPDRIPENANPAAYNNIFLRQTPVTQFGEAGTDALLHQDYTTVWFCIAHDLDLHKVSAEDGVTPVEGATFHLEGVSAYDTH